MKILKLYFGKLKYLYTRRLGCTFLFALFSYLVVAIILWLAVANEPKSPMAQPDEIKGPLLLIALVFFSFCVAPLVLRNKQ